MAERVCGSDVDGEARLHVEPGVPKTTGAKYCEGVHGA
jgi:hypothetical protein